MKPTKLFTLSAVAALSSILACSEDEAPAAEKKDLQVACNEMCRDSGFTNGKKEELANGVNCFCSVGPASSNVQAAACTKFCSSIGRGAGKPFGNTTAGQPDSCGCE